MIHLRPIAGNSRNPGGVFCKNFVPGIDSSWINVWNDVDCVDCMRLKLAHETKELALMNEKDHYVSLAINHIRRLREKLGC